MIDLNDLRTALSYTDPTAGPDIDAIIARARRRTALRRTVTSSSLATLALAGVVVAAVVTGVPGKVMSPGTESSDPGYRVPNPVLVADSTAAKVDEAPERFDPALRTLSVGKLPPGLISEGAEITPTRQTYEAFDSRQSFAGAQGTEYTPYPSASSSDGDSPSASASSSDGDSPSASASSSDGASPSASASSSDGASPSTSSSPSPVDSPSVDSSLDNLPPVTIDLGLSVTVLAKNVPLFEMPADGFGLPMPYDTDPTSPINGHPAECLRQSGHDPISDLTDCTALQWQYAPNAWAQVSYKGLGLSQKENAATARAVAESVHLTEGTPVQLPLSLNGASASLHPAITSQMVMNEDRTGMDDNKWHLRLVLVENEADLVFPENYIIPDNMVEIVMGYRDRATGLDFYGKPCTGKTTVGGHPARRCEDGMDLVAMGSGEVYLHVGGDDSVADRISGVERDLRLADPVGQKTWQPLR